jgi:phosphate transport system protein
MIDVRPSHPLDQHHRINHPFTILGYTFLQTQFQAASCNRRIQMPRKVSSVRRSAATAQSTQTDDTSSTKVRDTGKNPAAKPQALEMGTGSPDDLTRLALKGCLIARDAAFNVRDLLTGSSRMAFLAIKDCEKELDLIERQIDERLPAAITRVNEARARQLLASLKCTTDLERIGDLVMSVALRVQSRNSKMAASDVRQLVEMSLILRDMLDLIHTGFVTLDLECARKVLQMDKDVDRVCHALFQKHLAENVSHGDVSSFDVLLMAQALERAGDHTTNLAEDLYSLIEGRSLRHMPKKRAAQ